MACQTAPKKKEKTSDKMWKTQKENTNGTFALSDQTLSTSSKSPSIPSFQHPQQASRYQEDLFRIFLLLGKLQLLLCVFLSIRFHLRCELAPSRRGLQPTKIGSTPEVIGIEQRRTPVLYFVGRHLS